MKISIALFITLIFNSCLSYAAELKHLIQQNQQSSLQSYELYRKLKPLEITPRIWVIVQHKAQKLKVKKILDDLSKQLQKKIPRKPIQIIKRVPKNNQLRFFKQTDKKQAKKLYAALKQLIPNLQLKDFSPSYSRVKWIKAGHYELWLAPNPSQP